MNYLDIILLILLLFFFFMGLKRGFILSFLQLLGIVLVIVLIRQFGSLIREGIHLRLGISDTWAIILGYVAIFIIVMILAKLVTLILQKLMTLVSLGWLNSLLGGIFNLIFGFALIVILVLLIEVTSFSNTLGEARNRSVIYSSAKVLADDIINSYIAEIPGSRPAGERPTRPQNYRPL